MVGLNSLTFIAAVKKKNVTKLKNISTKQISMISPSTQKNKSGSLIYPSDYQVSASKNSARSKKKRRLSQASQASSKREIKVATIDLKMDIAPGQDTAVENIIKAFKTKKKEKYTNSQNSYTNVQEVCN